MRSLLFPFTIAALAAGSLLGPTRARAAGATAPEGTRTAGLTVSAVKCSSDAAAAATRSVLRERERELVACWEQELAADPEPTTKVTLSWTLRPDGSISNPAAEFPDARLDDASFAFVGCLKERVVRWKFRRPAGGALPVEVRLAFSGRGAAPSPAKAPLVGSIGKEALSKVLQEHAGEITACYEQELAVSKGLEGKVKLKWTVQADGSVVDVKVEEAGTTLPSRTAVTCMASRVGGWRFPPPKDGAIAVITNTWTLRTQVQAPKP